MQIVSPLDDLHEMPNPILWENTKTNQIVVCWFFNQRAKR